LVIDLSIIPNYFTKVTFAMFIQVKLLLLAVLPQILQRASFKLDNPLNIVSGGTEFMVVMLSVTVDPKSAMQRRCWKTGLKMKGVVSYLFIILLYYLTTYHLENQGSNPKCTVLQKILK
jgi:hypothetical protein